LYKYSRSYPSPDVYLNSILDSFDENKTPGETIWADYIFKYISSLADFHFTRLNRCIALLEDSGGFSPAYFLRFSETANNLNNLKNAVDARNWDGMVSIINEGIVVMPGAVNKGVDAYIKELTGDAFADARRDIEALAELTLPSEEEHKEDARKLKPIVSKLCDAVRMLTLSPAKKFGLDTRKAYVKEGYDADHVIMDKGLCISNVFTMGRKIV
jgi:hypothetical protein